MQGRPTIELMKRAKAGSNEAIDLLFESCAKKLLALIRLRLGPAMRHHLESGDILQATMLKAFENLESFRGEGSGSLMGWLVRIAENEIRDQHQFLHRERRDVERTQRASGCSQSLIVSVRSASSRVLLTTQEVRIEAAIEGLSEHQREVVLLRVYSELTYPEIAERLDTTPDACRMMYARAMARLSLELEGVV
jgi:RNA polymerase sigma-70 factor (ECF subfamily)